MGWSGAYQSLGKKAKQISNKYDGTVVLTGKSIWLDTFVRYLGSNGASQLSQQGLIIAPLNRIQGHPTNQYWKENISGLSQSKVIVIGEGSQLEISNELGISSIEDIVRISWDLDTRDIIIARNEKPKYIYGLAAMQLVKNMANVDVSLTEAMVEFGSFGHPTWLGLQVVLDTIISEVDDELVLKKNKQIFSTENGVLVAKDKMAFLIEGNHSILKYLTGELSPSKASIDSFEHNVINRHNFCSERGIIYKHIIFPDKHTIFEKDFPIYPMNILGKLYLRQLSLEARNLIIYPIESLSREKNISCLKYDTHLSDKGSLIVLKDILRNVDLVHIPTLRKIENSINKSIIRAGDLGSKLSHKPTEEVFILQPSWRIQSFTSPGGFNDGMIDILFSPDSYTDKTLLLFGDSFFRMMLPHFSAFFRKVICLRTRFFHKEMVELIQPDYVFSGNVERYLSQVASDTESHPFFLYPQIKNNQAKMDDIFLSALLAVTSPGSSFARNYVAP